MLILVQKISESMHSGFFFFHITCFFFVKFVEVLLHNLLNAIALKGPNIITSNN